MRSNINGTKLEIELYDIFEDMDTTSLTSMADAIAVQDTVIKYVVQQILDGWTDLDSRGGLLCVVSPEPTTGLDWAIREVAKRSSEASYREIERLADALKHERKNSQRLLDEIGKIRREER